MMCICSNCNKEFERNEMTYTKDCHGIPFRFVCWDCYNIRMEKGYDGQYYSELDENLEEDW